MSSTADSYRPTYNYNCRSSYRPLPHCYSPYDSSDTSGRQPSSHARYSSTNSQTPPCKTKPHSDGLPVDSKLPPNLLPSPQPEHSLAIAARFQAAPNDAPEGYNHSHVTRPYVLPFKPPSWLSEPSQCKKQQLQTLLTT
jgi:hypothetical protein